jgi:hypothetical protein
MTGCPDPTPRPEDGQTYTDYVLRTTGKPADADLVTPPNDSETTTRQKDSIAHQLVELSFDPPAWFVASAYLSDLKALLRYVQRAHLRKEAAENAR